MARRKIFNGCDYDCFNCKYEDCYQGKVSSKERKAITKRDEQIKLANESIDGVGYFIKSKRSVLSRLSVFILIPIILSLTSTMAKAKEPDLIKGYATAYYQTGKTATGIETHEGICASSRDRFGKAIILYKRLPNGDVGDYIGTYECQDTGGNPGIKKGTVIDIWCDGLDACQDFMDLVYEDGCQGKVYIQVIDEVKG